MVVGAVVMRTQAVSIDQRSDSQIARGQSWVTSATGSVLSCLSAMARCRAAAADHATKRTSASDQPPPSDNPVHLGVLPGATVQQLPGLQPTSSMRVWYTSRSPVRPATGMIMHTQPSHVLAAASWRQQQHDTSAAGTSSGSTPLRRSSPTRPVPEMLAKVAGPGQQNAAAMYSHDQHHIWANRASASGHSATWCISIYTPPQYPGCMGSCSCNP
jgi:hypothetical protein